MLEKKSEEANAQIRQKKRMVRVILFTGFLLLLLSSLSSIFFIVRSVEKGSQSVDNTETHFPASSATPDYLETPPAQSMFYDTFKNNALGWSISNASGYYRTIKPGKLILTNTNPGTTMIESLPTNSIFDDCKLIVDFTMLKANTSDSVGIYIRGDTNLEHDYRIDFYSNHTFDIAREYIDSRNNPQFTMLVGPQSVPGLKPQGESNTVTLIMIGSQLQLFVNTVQVSTVLDSNYSAGQVALFARLGDHSQEVLVSFSKVEIDKI